MRGVAALSVPKRCSFNVLVMDNDATPSAGENVARIADTFPFPLSYAHVTEPGLSSVRNYSLERGRDFDFLAMIDDDEVPERQWLAELLEVQAATMADAVIGPVPRTLPEDAPAWLRGARFFDLPVYPDRSLIRDGYSGNCLLRMTSVERLNLAFHRSLDFAGGEDLLFFRQLASRGGTLAYAAHAVAIESVGDERATASYILKLNFRRGNTLSLCDRYMSDRFSTILVRTCKALGLIARGGVTLIPYSVMRGKSASILALCDVARGVGALAGIAGYTYNAYARPE